MTNNSEGKMFMKVFHLMPYCVLAVRFLETIELECWLPDEFQVLFNVVFFKWVAMTECHVQLAHNDLIRIQTLNLRMTSTRHYPVEPLTFLNWIKPHGENVDWEAHNIKKTPSTHFTRELKGFLKRVQIRKFALLMVST